MDLSLSRIHHTQVAFAVYDFARNSNCAQVARGQSACGISLHQFDGARRNFYHRSALTINQLALQANLFTIEASDKFFRPMFPRRNYQVSRVLLFLSSLSRARREQSWIRLGLDSSFESTQFTELEHRISEWQLAKYEHERHDHGQQTKSNNNSSDKTG